MVVGTQNHDQVGNRVRGERLSHLVGFEELKLAAATALLSPFVPLLFMGEEYAETAPFPYFTSHSDPAVADGVRRGREARFAALGLEGVTPDPQAESTFLSAKLDRRLREKEPHRSLLALYRELLRLRREQPALANPDLTDADVAVDAAAEAIVVRRRDPHGEAMLVLGFGTESREVALEGRWRRALDTADVRWGGPGSRIDETLALGPESSIPVSPRSAVVLVPDGGS
jgi:maltooligosyltrehalose trehalohydrolase